MLIRKSQRGFTLVEILIVVILLGILASIALPQFFNAHGDARKAALSDQLNTLRAQIQLYTLQHHDTYPDLGTNWDPLVTAAPDRDGIIRGPYLPSIPRNPLNDFTGVAEVATDPAFGDAVAGASIGFVYNPVNGFIWGTNTTGNKVYNEGDPSDPNN